MGTVILIGTVAVLVAIVGCFFIWRIDASRAEEVEHQAPPPPPRPPTAPGSPPRATRARDRWSPEHATGREPRRIHPHGCPWRRTPVAGWRRAIRSVATSRGGTTMGLDDKIDNKGDELKGKAKEATGKATDDEQLEAEGKTDQAGANLKQAGEKVKDAFKG